MSARVKLVTSGYLRPDEDAMEVRIDIGGGDPGPTLGRVMGLVPAITSAFVDWQRENKHRRITWTDEPRVQSVFGNWYLVQRFRVKS